jgi:cell wall-associated NlpC family hydrolase
MPRSVRGRHRAPRRPFLKPLMRAGVTVAVTGGLAMSTAATSTATPTAAAKPASPTHTALPAAAGSAAAALGSAVTAPVIVLPTASVPKLRMGSRGSSVRRVQRIVGVYADGVFGPRTHRAVKRFQGRKGLYRDGIVGPRTARAMGLTYRSRASSSASRSSSRSSSSIVYHARRNLGARYRYAGSTYSRGFDCSGYVYRVFRNAGIRIPRTAAAMDRRARRVSYPRPGDLVFYNYPATHVGIYAGGGKMYDSGRSTRGTTLRRLFPGRVHYGRIG